MPIDETIMFPYMLYKHPGPHEIHGSNFDTRIVADGAEYDEAIADDWKPSTLEALKAVNAPIPKALTLVNAPKEPDLFTPPASPTIPSVGKPVRWKK